jgi:uncharacterized membrane protein YkvA (DUF1232 family)
MRKNRSGDTHPGLLKDVAMLFAGLVAVIYLLNPDAGLIELIPDNLPVIGNLDELAATVLLLRVWRHFRRHRRRWFQRGPGKPGGEDSRV